MGFEVIMPQLGESVVEGTVTKWLKSEGERVEEFEAILEVNTDKVDTEIPSPAGGELLKIFITAGETVRAGTVLAFIGEPGEAIPEMPAAVAEVAPSDHTVPAEPVSTAPVEPAQPEPSAVPVGREAGLGFISPVVAKMSAEHGIDLRQVKGTGSGGRITKQDLLAFLESQPSTAPWEQPASGELFRPTEEVFGEVGSPAVEPEFVPGTLLPIDPVRKSIADHMVRSVHTSPHVSTVMEADMTRVVAHRAENKAIFARESVNLTYSAYFIAAAVQALKAFPVVNSTWTDAGIQLHSRVNIGLAVSLGEKGLIVPVIPDADRLSLLAIAASVNDMAARARAGQLKPDEVHGGTFTITNHGTSGSLFATPIINQPQAAILGVGALQKRVVAKEAQTKDGEVGDFFAIRPMAYLSLTFDHRILDGAIGDAFLGKLVSTLEVWR